MAKFDIREFNYITCGKTQNTFNVSFCYTDDGMIQDSAKKPQILSSLRTTTFFGDIGEYDSMHQRYATNKESFYDIENKTIIHNLYELPKSKLKTTAVKYSSVSVSTEKIDMYVPHISDDFVNVVQFDNYAYGLTKMMDRDPIVLSVIMNENSNFDVTYHYTLSNGNMMTFTSPKPNEVSGGTYTTYKEVIDNAHQLSGQAISTIFKIKRDLTGVNHNYIVEIPEDRKYNDYTKGYIQCDQIVGKNHLDYTYTLSTNNDYTLSACRDYCNINVCAGQLYMTYRDNVNYTRSKQNNADVTHNNNNDNVEKINLTKQQLADSYSYQHIEVINSWNRWDGSINAGHKSSMFSLRLINTGLNQSTISESVKTKLRQNIVNNIRSIIETIIPANTQLFNVYFEGK